MACFLLCRAACTVYHLSSQIPQLNSNGALCDFPHVEAYCWYHILMKGTSGKDVDQRRLASILQSYQRQLHLFLEEQTAATKGHLNEQGTGCEVINVVLQASPAQPVRKSLPHSGNSCCGLTGVNWGAELEKQA